MSERPISKFSRDLSDLLQGFMRERGITAQAVADHLGRSKGFVSEHTSGKKPPDSDLLDAVADLAGVTTPALMAELSRRMALPDDVRETADTIKGAIKRGKRSIPRRGRSDQATRSLRIG